MGADLDFDIVELAPWVPPPGAEAPMREIHFRSTAWTPAEDDDLRHLFSTGLTLEYMTIAMGRGRGGVQWRLYELGLRRRCTLPWSELDDEDLAKRYGAEPAAAIAQSLGRTPTSVYARAGFLGLTEPADPPWTGWEDAQLRAGYAAGVPIQQIAALIGRTLSAQNSRASKLGLRHPTHPADWSAEEAGRAVELACEGLLYLEIIERLVAEGFPRRTKAGIGPKLRKMGYSRGWGRPWTDEERDLIRQAYAAGASLTPVAMRIGRTRTAMAHQIKVMGLQGTHPKRDGWRGRVWTPQEEARLREAYGKIPKADLVRELDRGWAAIQCRAHVLGVTIGKSGPMNTDEVLAIEIGIRQGLTQAVVARVLGRPWNTLKKHCGRNGLSFIRPGLKAAKAMGKTVHTLESILALEGRDLTPNCPLAPQKPRGRAAPSWRLKDAA